MVIATDSWSFKVPKLFSIVPIIFEGENHPEMEAHLNELPSDLIVHNFCNTCIWHQISRLKIEYWGHTQFTYYTFRKMIIMIVTPIKWDNLDKKAFH